MSGIIKPGDPGFVPPNSQPKQKRIPIGFFYKAGRCPECGMPAFIHSELPEDGTRFYRTCNCEDVDVKVTRLGGYDAYIERESLDYLFKTFEVLLIALETEQDKNAAHMDRDTDSGQSGVVRDGETDGTPA